MLYYMSPVERREQLEVAGRWLRQERERRGFTKLGSFARAVGVDPSQISNYERGVNAVSDDRAEQIANVLHMPLIEVRRNLGLWVPQESDDEATAATRLVDMDASEDEVTDLLLGLPDDKADRVLGMYHTERAKRAQPRRRRVGNS